MKCVLVSERPANKRLILLWAGWGMDHAVFAGLTLHGYDIRVVYDYRAEDFDVSEVCRGYDEIVVIAWSMGVYMASRWLLANPGLPVTRCLAVNGTVKPIDDECGIPERIYDLTSELPDERSLRKFYMRICGGAKAMAALLPALPERPLDELRDELHCLRRRVAQEPLPQPAAGLWDVVHVSKADLIFPPANMLRAWQGCRATLRIDAEGAHAPDFQSLIFDNVIDKELVGRRFARAARSYAEEARVQADVAVRLSEMAAPLLASLRADARILEVGAGDGTLTRSYLQLLPHDAQLEREDLYPIPSLAERPAVDIVTDSEQAIHSRPDESLDAILSSSTLQWFNSPRRYLDEICRVLRPGGFAALAYYGPGTFAELDNISGLCYPEISTDNLGEGLEAALQKETVTLHFPSATDALRHISSTGVNALKASVLSVGRTRRLLESLAKEDGTASLTFIVHYLIIRKNG